MLARPEKWRPRGGIIFDYQLPLDEHDERNFPPQFRVTYQPVEDDDGQSRYYANVKENLDKLIDEHEGVWDKYASWQSYSSEYIFLGGETQPVKSLKFIAHEYVHVERHPPDPLHTRSALGWRPITKDEYDRRVNNSKDGAELQYRGFDTEITYIFVVCYCEPLKTIYHFHFWDEHDHFLASSEWFNEIINSVRFLT